MQIFDIKTNRIRPRARSKCRNIVDGGVVGLVGASGADKIVGIVGPGQVVYKADLANIFNAFKFPPEGLKTIFNSNY